MPLVQNFSVSQTIGIPSTINLLDTSTGSDVLVTDRKVYITDVAGNYITANGSFTVATATDWPYADISVAIDCLLRDLSVNVRVDWLDVSGAILYTKTVLFDFTLYGLQGSFILTQALSAAPDTIQDTNYWMNRMILRCCIDDADLAVAIGGNQFIAQAALDREKYLLDNISKFF